MEIKNAKDDSIDSELVKHFSQKLAEHIKQKIYIGWQDNEKEIDRLKVDVSIFADFEEYECLNLNKDEELIDRIMKCIMQHYGIE